ncbi:MAG: iron ABC transporter permease [Alphaproteobacteria bacterium]|nr:iron ABC transporter permease [Alphaproteobacteria bacterium]
MAVAGAVSARRLFRGASTPDGWAWTTLAVAALAATPILSVVWTAVTPTLDIWHHLASTVLPDYVWTSFLLAVGVALGTAAIGVATAWLVTMYRFPGSRAFEWLLLLPLAMPAYLVAYVYTDLLEYAGPVQGFLRALFGWANAREYWFPEVRSLGGAVILFSLVLYPYVYLVSRAAFIEQNICVLEASRLLGCTPWRTFRRVALPLARPAVAIGVILALMETLNDLGAVEFFALRTFTVGIFDVWMNMGNAAGAAQLALVLLVVIAGLIWAERAARRQRRFHHTSGRYRRLAPRRLSGRAATGAFLVCALPVLLGFLLPSTVLAWYAFTDWHPERLPNFLLLAEHSLLLAGIAALAASVFGLVLAYGAREGAPPIAQGAARFVSLGYAVPGAVLALGVMIPLASLDRSIDALARAEFGISTGLLFSGTLFAVSAALTVRFLALAYGTIDAGLSKVTPNIDSAARTLGHGPLARLARVHLPIVRGSVLTGALLVFVDSMKELPMTLILRPFNYETLATNVYQYASDELLEECALPALAIVLAGVLPVLLLTRIIGHSRAGDELVPHRAGGPAGGGAPAAIPIPAPGP